MKRFIHFTLVLALILGFVSCKKDEILNTAKETTKDAPVVKNLPPKQKITLSASSNKPGLRVKYDASKGEEVTDDNTLWQEGDQIAVYNVGVNGSKALFTLVDGAGTSYGTFEGEIEPTGNYYGIYPFSAAGALDGTSIAITLPATQNYAEGSFGQNAAIFAATSTTSGSDVVLNFEPLLGYLSLSLTTLSNTSRDAESRVGGHSVGSIVLHENSLGGMSLSGAATVDMSSTPQLVSSPTGGGLDVKLNCGGVQLGSTPKEFIIAVPAGAFSKGLCATVNGTDGKKIMSLATTASNTITANYITQLPAQDVYNIMDIQGNSYPVSKIGPQIWMGENFRCLKYDTNSIGYIDRGEEGASYVLPNQKDDSPYSTYDPQYVDAEDETTWVESGSGSWAAGGIENVRRQKAHFGILYNWAAGMGFLDQASAIANGYMDCSKQQGVCPNGWHMPTFCDFLYGDGLAGYVNEGGARVNASNIEPSEYCLLSEDGWLAYEGNMARPDDFGFTAFPAGYCGDGGATVSNPNVGNSAMFLTSTAPAGDYSFYSIYAVCNKKNVPSGYTEMFSYSGDSKQSFAAVRCLKD